jgi:hypothetical protein
MTSRQWLIDSSTNFLKVRPGRIYWMRFKYTSNFSREYARRKKARFSTRKSCGAISA